MCWNCKELSGLVDSFNCSVPESSKECQQCVGLVKVKWFSGLFE